MVKKVKKRKVDPVDGKPLSSDTDESTAIITENLNTIEQKDVNNTAPKMSHELYKATDKQPFHVIAEFTNEQTNALILGKLLMKKQIKSIQRIDVLSKRKARITLADWKQANKIVTTYKEGYDEFKPFIFSIPSMFVHTEGIIRNVPLDITEDEIRNHTVSSAPITTCTRMTYWNFEKKLALPSNTIKLTFRANKVPDEVFCYYTVFKVAPFIPKPLYCRQCLSYGHINKFCKAQQSSCKTCTEPTHGEEKNCTPKCKHCIVETNQDKHITNARTCPEYLHQYEIKKIMTTNKITFREAKLKLKKREPTPAESTQKKQTYADATKNGDASLIQHSKTEIKENQIGAETIYGKLIKDIAEILNKPTAGPGNNELAIFTVKTMLQQFMDKAEAGPSHI